MLRGVIPQNRQWMLTAKASFSLQTEFQVLFPSTQSISNTIISAGIEKVNTGGETLTSNQE